MARWLGLLEAARQYPRELFGSIFDIPVRNLEVWDRLNQTLPNFRRWEQFLQGASQAEGGKPIILWQVPVGNQYFQSENNTDNHYQDNRVEYIFGHIPELIQTGVIGALLDRAPFDSGPLRAPPLRVNGAVCLPPVASSA